MTDIQSGMGKATMSSTSWGSKVTIINTCTVVRACIHKCVCVCGGGGGGGGGVTLLTYQ